MRYIVLDLDNTLCDSPAWNTLEEFHKQDHARFLPLQRVIDKLYCKESLGIPTTYIFLTSRSQSLYFATRKWIDDHTFILHRGDIHLFMRPFENLQDANILKTQTLENLGITPQSIRLWLDDDLDVISMGIQQGYNILHPTNYLSGE